MFKMKTGIGRSRLKSYYKEQPLLSGVLYTAYGFRTVNLSKLVIDVNFERVDPGLLHQPLLPNCDKIFRAFLGKEKILGFQSAELSQMTSVHKGWFRTTTHIQMNMMILATKETVLEAIARLELTNIESIVEVRLDLTEPKNDNGDLPCYVTIYKHPHDQSIDDMATREMFRLATEN